MRWPCSERIVGTAGAYAALLAWHRSDLSPLGHVPVVNLIVILVGLPVIATAPVGCCWGRAARHRQATHRVAGATASQREKERGSTLLFRTTSRILT